MGLLCFMALLSRGQEAPSSLTIADSLHFMLGEWTGKGWIQQGRAGRSYFFQEERIETHVGGQTILILGKGRDTATQALVHDALGVLYYDADSAGFYMHTFSTAGEAKKTPLEFLSSRIFRWRFSVPRGTVRFTEDYSKEGFWTSKGEFSFDGESWFPFFEMLLEKT